MNYYFYFTTLAISFISIANTFTLPGNFFSGIIDKIIGSDNSVDVPQKGGNFELDVSSNTDFSINLAGNPTTGYQWYLDNEEEVKASSIVLIGQNFTQKKNSGKVDGTSGNFVFSFKANEVCGKELPKLSFVYKRSWETEAPAATSEITLKVDCEKKQQKMMEADGSLDIAVKVDEPFQVKLAGNPTTGYSWVLKNIDEISASPFIEQLSNNYITDESEEGMVGVGGTFIFEFEVSKEACGQNLPKLVFNYEKSWENDEPVQTAEYTLKLDEEECEASTDDEDDQQHYEDKIIEVKNGENFTVKLEGNPTTGYSWLLANEEEIAASGVVEKVKEDFIEGEHKDEMDGVSGTFTFEFKVNNACGIKLPKLSFVYKQPWNEEEANAEKTEYTLKLNDDEDCAQVAIETNEIEVKNNETFTIQLGGNPTTGYSWLLANEEEITASGTVEKVKEDYVEDGHDEEMDGVSGNFVFEFKVNNACGKELPKLSFVYKQPWNEDDTNAEKTEYTLKLSGCEQIETNDKKEIDVKNNETFTVELEGNPTTGYSWLLVNEEEIAASGIVEKVKEDYVEDGHDEEMDGVSGNFVFEFKVNDACGKELPKLSFVYKQPWNEDDKDAEKAEYTLVLKDTCN
jgi:predicted secreted protein